MCRDFCTPKCCRNESHRRLFHDPLRPRCRERTFEQDVTRIHRAIKARASRYFIEANPLIVLSAPVIYSLIVPVVLVDIWVMAYQAICFPVYGIPKVRRRDAEAFREKLTQRKDGVKID
jgi:hypothetical protein